MMWLVFSITCLISSVFLMTMLIRDAWLDGKTTEVMNCWDSRICNPVRVYGGWSNMCWRFWVWDFRRFVYPMYLDEYDKMRERNTRKSRER